MSKQFAALSVFNLEEWNALSAKDKYIVLNKAFENKNANFLLAMFATTPADSVSQDGFVGDFIDCATYKVPPPIPDSPAVESRDMRTSEEALFMMIFAFDALLTQDPTEFKIKLAEKIWDTFADSTVLDQQVFVEKGKEPRIVQVRVRVQRYLWESQKKASSGHEHKEAEKLDRITDNKIINILRLYEGRPIDQNHPLTWPENDYAFMRGFKNSSLERRQELWEYAMREKDARIILAIIDVCKDVDRKSADCPLNWLGTTPVAQQDPRIASEMAARILQIVIIEDADRENGSENLSLTKKGARYLWQNIEDVHIREELFSGLISSLVTSGIKISQLDLLVTIAKEAGENQSLLQDKLREFIRVNSISIFSTLLKDAKTFNDELFMETWQNAGEQEKKDAWFAHAVQGNISAISKILDSYKDHPLDQGHPLNWKDHEGNNALFAVISAGKKAQNRDKMTKFFLEQNIEVELEYRKKAFPAISNNALAIVDFHVRKRNFDTQRKLLDKEEVSGEEIDERFMALITKKKEDLELKIEKKRSVLKSAYNKVLSNCFVGGQFNPDKFFEIWIGEKVSAEALSLWVSSKQSISVEEKMVIAYVAAGNNCLEYEYGDDGAMKSKTIKSEIALPYAANLFLPHNLENLQQFLEMAPSQDGAAAAVVPIVVPPTIKPKTPVVRSSSSLSRVSIDAAQLPQATTAVADAGASRLAPSENQMTQ